MKNLKRKLALFLAFVAVFSLQVMPVFAATASKTASSTASVYLTPGDSGETNIVSF